MCRLRGILEWIIVKGICDWGYKKNAPNKESDQALAADAAVDYCFHVFSRDGVFDDLLRKYEKMKNSIIGGKALCSTPIDVEQYKSVVDNYRKKVSESTSFVKTLINSSEPVCMNDFYVCNNVTCTIGNKFHSEENISSEFITNSFHYVILTGTGGIGKSMMIRHLLLDTVEKGRFIPVIITLKNYSSNSNSIIAILTDQLLSFKCGWSDEYINYALENGKFLLLLDGLDEIKTEESVTFEHDLEGFFKFI